MNLYIHHSVVKMPHTYRYMVVDGHTYQYMVVDSHIYRYRYMVVDSQYPGDM